MGTMNNGTKWNDTVTIKKQSGTKVTIDTDGKYVEKNIELTINVKAGSATTPNTTITADPTLSINSYTGAITANVNATKTVMPIVSAGYVSTGSVGTITVSGSSAMRLATQNAQFIIPGTTNQTISAGKYLTGTQTIAGDSDLVSGNIKSGTSIFNVAGSFTDSSTVSSGQTAASASEIRSGYSAWVDGVEVQGAMEIATIAETKTYLGIV